MNNPVCAVCGHVNRVGAVACEACDARLDTTGSAFADEPPREPSDDTREPFDSTAGSSWTASDTGEPGGAWSPHTPADDIPAPPFKGAGDVISPMLAVYRKHFTLVGALVLVTMVPEALLQFAFVGGTASWGAAGMESDGLSLMAFTLVVGLILWLVTVTCGALLSGSLVYAVVDLQRAGRSSVSACLSRGLNVLWKVLLVTIIQSLVTGFGFLLFIVPGVILSLMFAVSIPVAVIEGRGPIDAMTRSNELTKGYKGLTFITYFLWGLLVIVLSMLISWSFSSSQEEMGLISTLPMLLIQSAVLGMLNSTLQVLTAYIYLGLLREHRSGFQTNTFTPGPEAAAR
jgi:hypothetical protein